MLLSAYFKNKNKDKKNLNVTSDTWHVICDTWHVVLDEHSLKISAPLLLRFEIEGVLKIWRKSVSQQMNELMTKVFVEEPRLHLVC